MSVLVPTTDELKTLWERVKALEEHVAILGNELLELRERLTEQIQILIQKQE